MSYTLDMRRPVGLAAGLRSEVPAHARIAGLPADCAVRIAVPLVLGGLSVAGLIYSSRGQANVAVTFALTGVLLSSMLTAVQVAMLEEHIQGGT